jgi:hypothetical protein
MVINHHGVATGWTLASGHVQERWVAESLCSTRAGMPGGQGPLDAEAQQLTVTPPRDWLAILPSGGARSPQPILTARGFRGERGLADALGRSVRRPRLSPAQGGVSGAATLVERCTPGRRNLLCALA